ncbi:GntR family transcriptional regulator [Microbacterium sp. NPDC089695]|uniref:GntR family transcriptional regulator n=1 Tax=Microbacterium sp. NPDC089695 TaxID=3364198 RepID=UPI003812FE16
MTDGRIEWVRGDDDGEPQPIHSLSQRDVVVDAFLAAIDNGTLAPGEKLTVSTLAKQFGVAAATVREALAALNTLNLVEEQPNRPSRIVTPTPKWYVAMAAECAGLSIAATDLGIANATDEEREAFADHAARARAAWMAPTVDQLSASAAVWDLIQLLADWSGNRHIARLHEEKRHALAFGIAHLTRPRNAKMLISAVEALSVAVRMGDRDEGVDIVRDLYAFVTVPFLENDSRIN